MKVGAALSTTCFAPASRNSCACSGLRTMLTSGTPSAMQMRFSICPRLDAAAVCTSALWPSRRMVSTMPSAVSGLTKHDAPSAGLVPGGSTRHWSSLMVRYCAYIAPPSSATVLPSSACAAADEPAATTTPAPSLPTGSDWPARPAIARSARSGTRAVALADAPLPDVASVSRSAAPNSKPMSDGLIGAASTRTTTSVGSGGATSTACSASSSSPLAWISERSCRPRWGMEVDMGRASSGRCSAHRGAANGTE